MFAQPWPSVYACAESSNSMHGVQPLFNKYCTCLEISAGGERRQEGEGLEHPACRRKNEAKSGQ